MTYLILIEFYYFHLTYKENEVHGVLFACVYHVAMFLKCFSSLLEFHSLFLNSRSPIYSLRISSRTVSTHLFLFVENCPILHPCMSPYCSCVCNKVEDSHG